MRRNTENQYALFRYKDLFSTFCHYGVDSVDLLTEIVRDNRIICHQLSDVFISRVIDLIAHVGRHSRYVRFLQVRQFLQQRGFCLVGCAIIDRGWCTRLFTRFPLTHVLGDAAPLVCLCRRW